MKKAWKEFDFSKLNKPTAKRLIVHHHDLLLEITDNMEKWGGDFVKALAVCIRRADPINKQKLVYHFSEYILKYTPEKWARK